MIERNGLMRCWLGVVGWGVVVISELVLGIAGISTALLFGSS